jgi:hypothetical protein
LSAGLASGHIKRKSDITGTLKCPELYQPGHMASRGS